MNYQPMVMAFSVVNPAESLLAYDGEVVFTSTANTGGVQTISGMTFVGGNTYPLNPTIPWNPTWPNIGSIPNVYTNPNDLISTLEHFYPEGIVVTDHWVGQLNYIFLAAYRVSVAQIPKCKCGSGVYEMRPNASRPVKVKKRGYRFDIFVADEADIQLPLLQCQDCTEYYYHLYLMEP